MSVDTPADNQGRGFGVEQSVADRWPAERVDDDWRDLQLVADVHGKETGVRLLTAGTSIEVKSCLARYNGRSGRIWIRRQTHERLLEEDPDAQYAVGVLEDGTLQRLGLIRASTVDKIIDGEWWDCGDGGQTAEQYRQIPWTAIYHDLEAPTRGDGA